MLELDLTQQAAVRAFFEAERPEQVYLAAAKVGGIHANQTYPAEFIYQNLMIETHIIHEAWRVGVQKLLFLGSSCIYPRLAAQPIPEEALLTGTLEATNEPYAIAKIAGIKLCESYNRQYGTDYRSVMPTNLYGPGDNFDLESSHVIPALMAALAGVEMADAEHAALDLAQAGAQREVETFVDQAPQRIGIHTRRRDDAGEHRRVHRRIGALDGQAPGAHRAAHAPWYPGRAVMIQRNDHLLKLFNGDIGICLPDAGGELMVWFPEPSGGWRRLPPLRLPAHEDAFALPPSP